jgi:hypothetical protein
LNREPNRGDNAESTVAADQQRRAVERLSVLPRDFRFDDLSIGKDTSNPANETVKRARSAADTVAVPRNRAANGADTESCDRITKSVVVFRNSAFDIDEASAGGRNDDSGVRVDFDGVVHPRGADDRATFDGNSAAGNPAAGSTNRQLQFRLDKSAHNFDEFVFRRR